MKERLNKFIHGRLFIIVLIGILMCTTLLVGTYAWFTWSSTDNTKLVMVINGLADVVFESGNDINGNLTPVYDYKKDGLKTNFTVTYRDTNSILSYDIKLNITTIEEELKREDVKWVLEKNGVLLSEGDFSSVDNGTTVILANSFSSSYTTSYTFYLYIDGNQENDLSMMNKNITGNLVVEGIEKSAELLTTYIKNLYTSAQPVPIEHLDTEGNKIADYYYSYQDSEQTWGLMNDGLKIADDSSVGATTVDSDAAENGTEGNIRYFGPGEKVNNYIYFNCSDYSNQTDSTCEKWRIIGIVDGKVKLIRNESIGNYSWDNKNPTTGATTKYGSNNWSDARLMRLLNPGYENFFDKDNSNNNLIANNSLYWNSGSGSCYYGTDNATKNCDFTSTGIKNDKTKKMISNSTWFLGGYGSSSVYPNQIYTYERKNKVGETIYGTNPYTIDAKIGLMYTSDFGYGTNLKKCNQKISDYDSSTDLYACRENNWLFNEASQWTITPWSSDYTIAWTIASTSRVWNTTAVYNAFSVRPVLYLNEDIMIDNIGNGSFDKPYQIYVEPTKLTEHIVNLYTSGNPEPITHDKDCVTSDTYCGTSDTYYYSYPDDNKSWGLMNDGLKIADDSGVGAIAVFLDDAKKGTEGNIRYFGPEPNNYIYFNCSDYSNQTDSTCEKWRIIGIVDGKVKLIRNESIGDLAWDYDKNQDSSLTTYSNNWEKSSLQKFLNGLYYNRGTTTTYTHYYMLLGDYSSTLNMSTIGLKNDTTRNMISESTWYLGGYNTSDIYPNQIYTYERKNDIWTTIYGGNPYTIKAKIGLMYASDYGYGTDLTKCSQNFRNYEWNYNSITDTYPCIANNWLFNDVSEWLITPNQKYSNQSWYVYSGGEVCDSSFSTVDSADGVRPVLYLNTELAIESEGDGSSTNPYRIIVR